MPSPSAIRLFATSVLFLILCGCSFVRTRTASPSTGDYIPGFERIPKGYRPYLPHYSPQVTYRFCEYMGGERIADIQEKFVIPLVAWESSYDGKVPSGKYHQLIGAVVINGGEESIRIDFTIWLLDGRRLDSGDLFFDQSFDQRGVAARSYVTDHMGHAMYDRAMEMLRKAIPESKVRAAHAPGNSRNPLESPSRS